MSCPSSHGSVLFISYPLLSFCPEKDVLDSDGSTWRSITPEAIGSHNFVVIFDDALSVLANGAVPATVHRVRLTENARMSLIFFLALDGLVVPPAAYGERDRSDRQLERWWESAVRVSGSLL